MKPLDHANLRRLLFTAYALVAAVFCVILYRAGAKEVERVETEAARAGRYADGLVLCQERLNAFAVERSFASASDFRRGAESLLSLASDKEEATRLGDFAAKAQALSLALAKDLSAPEPERGLLLASDSDLCGELCNRAAVLLQGLLKTELEQVGIWRRESLEVFTRLQYMLAFFFIAATGFGVGASYAYGYLLKSSLRRLREGTGALREGHLDYRFKELPADEIGEAMRDVNTMAGRLEAQTERLIAANRHKDNFLANMSHELRTPLNAVAGFADIIERRAIAEGRTKDIADAKRISVASEHLLELISGLLEIAKFDAGKLTPELSTFDLSTCVGEAIALLTPLASKKGLEVRKSLPQGLSVQADERMIRQLVINLLGNAIKFTESGFVAVRILSEEKKFILEVEDSGIGISKEDSLLLFNDFHRAESGLTARHPGTGIGLALSRRLVELHGGRIIFESSPGKGSLFKAEIPKTKRILT